MFDNVLILWPDNMRYGVRIKIKKHVELMKKNRISTIRKKQTV